MRFKEFKVYLTEEVGGYYTIGDSHAVAVAMAGGKTWTNLAIGGKPSTDKAMLANISKVPKGAVVLVSQGANDTANAMRSFMDSDGKGKLKDPNQIASNVANVVNAVQARGAKVVFLLFPNGPGRGAGLAKYYGGDYQDDVRKAIRNAVDAPIIDLNGKPLTDGVHATMPVYREVARQVAAGNVPKVTGDAGGGATDTKADNPGDFVIKVPNGRVGPEVADVQKALMALGYDLPKHGVDGVRGIETSSAVKEFQQKYNLEVDGDPGPETVAKLNAVLSTRPDVASKLKNSTSADVHANVYNNDKLEPVEYSSVTKGKIGKLLDLIAKPESGGHYDIMMGGKRDPAILKMSLAELLQYQRAYKARGAETAAAGRYQFMPDTLRGTASVAGMDLNKNTFDPQTQDELAITLLRQKGLDSWLNGKMSDETFMDRLAQVWAGLPSPSKNGASWYQGVGSNRAGISVAAVQNTLNDIKSA